MNVISNRITYNPASGYDANNQKVATIKTWAQYPLINGAFSNLEVSATVQDPSFSPPSKLTVRSFAYGGDKLPSDFAPYKVSGTTVSLDTPTIFPAGDYYVTQTNDSDYTTTYSADCNSSGYVNIGFNENKTCVIVNTYKSKTANLTVIADVVNPYGGSTKSPSDFKLYIDGVELKSGQSKDLSTESGLNNHKVSAGSDPDYTAGDWSLPCEPDGDITLNPGNPPQTCKVVYTKNAPPSPSCADTLMMLDRTISMFGDPQWILDEKTAAKALLKLYQDKIPPAPLPQVGVGRFGNNSGVSADIIGQLTDNYGTDSSTGDASFISPTAQVADTGGDGNGFELNPTNAFSDGSGYASNMNGAGDRHRFYNYNFSIPSGATINGIEVRLDWWLDSTYGNNSMSVELSWNGGTNWTSVQTSSVETTSDTNNKILGGSTNNWGRTWSFSNFSNANFRVRVTSNSNYSTRDFYLDWVPVKVYYTIPSSGLYSVIENGLNNVNSWTNLGDAITVGATELKNHGLADKEKVLILISDGTNVNLDQNNIKAGSGATTQSAINWAKTASDNAKLGSAGLLETNIYTIHFGNANPDGSYNPAPRDFIAGLASGDYPISGHQPGSKNDAGTSNDSVLIYNENHDGDNFYISPTSDMQGVFEDIGRAVCPAAGGGTPPTPSPPTITVITEVFNNYGGSKQPSDVTISIPTAVDPNQQSLPGKAWPGDTIIVSEGSYNITGSDLENYTKSDDCAGTISAGSNQTCKITYNQKAPSPPPLPPPPPNIIIDIWKETP